jgi:hypothetical protein
LGQRHRLLPVNLKEWFLMWVALIGLLVAAVIFAASGGHILFLPLLFLLPLGGLFGHRRYRR